MHDARSLSGLSLGTGLLMVSLGSSGLVLCRWAIPEPNAQASPTLFRTTSRQWRMFGTFTGAFGSDRLTAPSRPIGNLSSLMLGRTAGVAD